MRTSTAQEPASGRRGQLALALQEAFTVAVRLRSNRQVAANADAFRAQIKQLLASTDRDARRAGYDGEYVRLAVYAFIAFLDESVLNSGQAMFANWPQQPLQEEIFGDHVAGENFFRHLSELLTRQDSEDLADLLEVYLLCLLLGFRGKYGANPGALHGVTAAVQDKLRRIRGGPYPFSPAWALPPNETVPASRDPWLPRLAIAAAAAFALLLVLQLVAHFALGGRLDSLESTVTSLTAGQR
jgi:type VI secretion system protein ImpK